ncbi:MAG: ornithine carbamoyltransferase [Caldimonas sp.]
MRPHGAVQGDPGSEPFNPVTLRELNAVLESARSLQAGARRGALQRPLRGKHLCVLVGDENDADMSLFSAAAAELGARVTVIPSSLTELTTPLEVRHTARMLGRLYDAVECQGMAPELVRSIANEAGVPVYDAIASADHPTVRLAESIDGEMSAAENRRFVLQAVLATSIG